jgi:hypothetical protein
MSDQPFTDDPDQPLLHPITGEELPPSTSWTDWLLIEASEVPDDERWEQIQAAARFQP